MGVHTQVELTTSVGAIRFELEDEAAPITVRNFLAYVGSGFYAGTVFHRVIPNFMIRAAASMRCSPKVGGGQLPPIRNESANDSERPRHRGDGANVGTEQRDLPVAFINVRTTTS
jgi:cyclophilin family peptidyl-prolyl cis-trans isomerase